MIRKKSKAEDGFARYEATRAAKEMPALAPPDPGHKLTPLEDAKRRLREAGRLTKITQGGYRIDLLDGVSATPAQIIVAAAKL